MKIIQYPHPTLRRRSKPLRRVDAELVDIIQRMFELIYHPEHRGIGLAANQVDLPYRLFVVNISGDPALKDEEQVFINPVLSQPKGSAEEEEGCLSLPGLYAPVRRPEKIHVTAYDLSGRELSLEADGLLARCIQHETDHLDGVLFIDRLAPTARMAVAEDLAEFEGEFQSQQASGQILSQAAIEARWAELERLRT